MGECFTLHQSLKIGSRRKRSYLTTSCTQDINIFTMDPTFLLSEAAACNIFRKLLKKFLLEIIGFNSLVQYTVTFFQVTRKQG